MKRRDWLRYGAAVGAACMLPPSVLAKPGKTQADSAARARILFVILRGACDTDSLLFQPDNPFYYKARPSISIGRNSLSSTALKIDNNWALHPACPEMADFASRGQLAFVPFCGSGNNSRSHFLAQHVIEQAAGADYNPGLQSGLVNRLVGELSMQDPFISGVCFSSQSPIICQGKASVPVFPPPRINQQQAAGRQGKGEELLQQLYSGTSRGENLLELEKKRIEARERFEEGEALAEASRANRPQSNLAQFARMADLLKGGGQFSVGVIEIGGWDSHVNQGAEEGMLAGKFRDLSKCLGAFAKRMGAAWSNTEVVVMSEFGRTFHENGSKGTDHGHGSTWVLMSGKGFPEPVLGRQIEITENNLHEKRDMPILNEYRAVLKRYTLRSAGLDAKAIDRLLYL